MVLHASCIFSFWCKFLHVYRFFPVVFRIVCKMISFYISKWYHHGEFHLKLWNIHLKDWTNNFLGMKMMVVMVWIHSSNPLHQTPLFSCTMTTIIFFMPGNYYFARKFGWPLRRGVERSREGPAAKCC